MRCIDRGSIVAVTLLGCVADPGFPPGAGRAPAAPGPADAFTDGAPANGGSCAAPPGLQIPPWTTAAGRVVHWAVASCIPVTYDPAIAAMLPLIEEALRAWQPACSSLCFGAPTVGAADVDALLVADPGPRLHFAPGGSSTNWLLDPHDPYSLSQSMYDETTGRIRVSLVELCTGDGCLPELCDPYNLEAPCIGGPPDTRAAVRALGITLLKPPTAGVASVLHMPAIAGASEGPSAGDLETLCAVYANPPLCGSDGTPE